MLNVQSKKSDILNYVREFDVVSYTRTRNHLSGTVSRLSPYITRGVISLPEVRAVVLERYTKSEAEKFIQELAWREYFQKVYWAKGEAIFSDLRFSRNDWRHHEVVRGITTANTRITAVDEEIARLMETGYMHNHARMWTAMLACNVAKAHWSVMSRWMYYHLLDGDLASNTLSWQWVAGTSVQKQYVADQQLINACGDTKQIGTYLDIPRELVGTSALPRELAEHDPFLYTMSYPESDTFESLAGKKVFLYHSWSVDPEWRAQEEGERIFIIEPQLFDRLPVSPLVCKYVLELVRTHVPRARVYVGNVDTLPDIAQAKVFSKAHPTTLHFPGTKDAPDELFPEVKGYYPSFFTFWQACTEGV